MRSLFRLEKFVFAIVRFAFEWRQSEKQRGRGSEFWIRFIHEKKKQTNRVAHHQQVCARTQRRRLLWVVFSLCDKQKCTRWHGGSWDSLEEIYIWIYGWLKRWLAAIINSISNKLTSCWLSQCRQHTQWEVGLWHNSVGIVVLDLQVFSFSVFQLRVPCSACSVRSMYRCILLLTMTSDELVLQSRITAPNVKFEQTSWHRNSKLVGRIGDLATHECSVLSLLSVPSWMSDVCSFDRWCHPFCTTCADETWRKLNEAHNLHFYYRTSDTLNFIILEWRLQKRAIFTSTKFESNNGIPTTL